ncbi:unnamed protein product [Sympodiomycopsis kandeliae]
MAAMSSQRTSLACLPCRNAKVKCDGKAPSGLPQASSSSITIPELSADPCSRCKHLQVPCSWKACNRSGRPSRKPDQAELSLPAPSADDQLRSLPQLAGVDPWPTLEHLDSAFDFVTAGRGSSSDHHLSLIGTSNSMEDLLNTCQSHASPRPISLTGECDDPTYAMFSHQNDPLAPTVTSTLPTHEDHSMSPCAIASGNSHPTSSSSSSDWKRLQKRLKTTDRGEETAALNLYFAAFGLSLPFLGSRNQYREVFEPLATRCSAFAAAAIGLASTGLEDGRELKEFYNLAQEMSVASSDNGKHTDLATSLDLIAGNLLLAYMSYSREETCAAQNHLHRSAKLAFEIQLEGSLATEAGDVISATKRSVWFELQVANALLSTSTGGRIKSYDSSALFEKITHPVGLGTPAGAQGGRVEAALLLHDCTRPRVLSMQGFQRLVHLDHVILNCVSKAQAGWYALHRRLSPIEKESKASIEASLLDTALLLHAGRIQLHRMMWCADISFELTLCSLHRHDGRADASEQDEAYTTATWQRDASLKAMSESAREMVLIFRKNLESLPKVGDRTADKPSSAFGSPFIACCHLAAMYGLCISLVTCDTDGNGNETSQKAIKMHRRELLSDMELVQTSMDALSVCQPLHSTIKEEMRRIRRQIKVTFNQ